MASAFENETGHSRFMAYMKYLRLLMRNLALESAQNHEEECTSVENNYLLELAKQNTLSSGFDGSPFQLDDIASNEFAANATPAMADALVISHAASPQLSKQPSSCALEESVSSGHQNFCNLIEQLSLRARRSLFAITKSKRKAYKRSYDHDFQEDAEKTIKDKQWLYDDKTQIFDVACPESDHNGACTDQCLPSSFSDEIDFSCCNSNEANAVGLQESVEETVETETIEETIETEPTLNGEEATFDTVCTVDVDPGDREEEEEEEDDDDDDEEKGKELCIVNIASADYSSDLAVATIDDDELQLVRRTFSSYNVVFSAGKKRVASVKCEKRSVVVDGRSFRKPRELLSCVQFFLRHSHCAVVIFPKNVSADLSEQSREWSETIGRLTTKGLLKLTSGNSNANTSDIQFLCQHDDHLMKMAYLTGGVLLSNNIVMRSPCRVDWKRFVSARICGFSVDSDGRFTADSIHLRQPTASLEWVLTFSGVPARAASVYPLSDDQLCSLVTYLGRMLC
uniref:RNase_Zc3h12a domain-containing protein n=1 Tax=Trichuris muris TaxID=70415 RepID=A0A5S6Q1D8_TRIMR